MTVCVLCRKSVGEDQYFIVQRPEKGTYGHVDFKSGNIQTSLLSCKGYLQS